MSKLTMNIRNKFKPVAMAVLYEMLMMSQSFAGNVAPPPPPTGGGGTTGGGPTTLATLLPSQDVIKAGLGLIAVIEWFNFFSNPKLEAIWKPALLTVGALGWGTIVGWFA